MNFNPMDLILIKEHFLGCCNEKEISKFINILIDLQSEGVQDNELKSKLSNCNFFEKNEMIELAYKIRGK